MPKMMAALPNTHGAVCESSVIPFLVPRGHAAKFYRYPLLECRAVTLPIYENARLGRKVNFAPAIITSGARGPKVYILYIVPALEMAKHRAKFICPLLSDVGALKKLTRETRYNLLGCPKLVNRSQPLVGRSSLYCEDLWKSYCCF